MNLNHIKDLIGTMAFLRDSKRGCVWDAEQTFLSLRKYIIEEAYELVEAINQNNPKDIQEECGDLLLQVVFICQIANENGLFDIEDAAKTITHKIKSRRPDLFDPSSTIERPKTAKARKKLWEEIKAAEKAKAKIRAVMAAESNPNNTEKTKSPLPNPFNDIPRSMPATLRAEKIQRRTARYDFDWEKPSDILDKIIEEVEELREALDHGTDDDIQSEAGDLLFAIINFLRFLDLSTEQIMHKANEKFMDRFLGMLRLSHDQLVNAGSHRDDHAQEPTEEAILAYFKKLSLAEKEKLWQKCKDLHQ